MRSRSFRAVGAALIVTQLLYPSEADALTNIWIGPPGVTSSWTLFQNWSLNRPPDGAGGDEAQIANGGVAEILSTGLGTTGSVVLGNGATSSGRLSMRLGTLILTASEFRIGGRDTGGGGTGVLDLSGGTIQLGPGNLMMGMGPAGNGTLNVSGGTLKFFGASLAAIGNSGTGTVNQTGGTVYVRGNTSGSTFATATVQLGRNTATVPSSGSYTLSGGTLAVTNVRFGQVAGTTGVSTNTFNLQGTGALIVKEITILNPAATNTFSFTGGSLQAQLIGVPLTNTGGVFDPSLALFNGVGEFSQLAIDPVTTATFTENFGYTQAGSGRLRLHLRDALQYDVVDVGGSGTGVITLGGFVDVNPLSGFDPGLGSFFDVVKADSLSFSAQVVGQTPSGRSFAPSIVQGEDGRQVLRLTVVVPEPGTVGLLGCAVLSLAVRRRESRR